MVRWAVVAVDVLMVGAFSDDAGRDAHFVGGAGEVLSLGAPDVLARPPEIECGDVIAAEVREELVTRALIVAIEAKPGVEASVVALLNALQPLAVSERGTVAWFALRFGPSQFASVGFFADDTGRESHRGGCLIGGLVYAGLGVFVGPPTTENLDILAAKLDALALTTLRSEM